MKCFWCCCAVVVCLAGNVALAEKIAIIGDSIAAGDTIQTPETESIQAHLKKGLKGKHDVQQFGVGGATARIQGAKPYIQQPEFTKARDFDPKLVIIILGTNDSTEAGWDSLAFRRDYGQMIRDIQKWPSKPRIVLCTPPSVEKEAWGIRAKTVEEGVAWEVNIAATMYMLPKADLHKATKGTDGLTSDGVHPNPKGTKVIAEEIQKTLAPKKK